MDNFNIMQNPIVPGQQPMMNTQPIVPDIPTTVKTGGFKFTVVSDDSVDVLPPANHMNLINPDAVDMSQKARRGRPKKDNTQVATVNGGDIVRSESGNGTVEENPTIYTYAQTTSLLHETIQQVDMVAAEIKSELDAVRLSRTMKNKQNYMVGLTTGLGKLLETKVSAISQLNNCISKANDMDYKKEKDRRESQANQAADDKYIMDMYNSFITNNVGNQNVLGPNILDTTVSSVNGSAIVRSTGNVPEGQMDVGYLNYLSRLTPEQNMMFYENDPNVKTVVVYDESTGHKFFQVMNMATGQPVPNVPVLDNRFMEDTTIDLRTKTAKNNNLHEVYPVIVINNDITKEY